MIAWLACALLAGAASPPAATWRSDAPPTSEIDLPRFRILSTAAALGTARLLAGRLEQDRDLVTSRLGEDYQGATEVRVGEGIDELARLDLPDSSTPAWAAGLARGGENLILLDASALRRPGGVGVVRHELTHVALDQLGGLGLPRWFQEGMAVLAAGEWSAESDLTMMRAGRAGIPLRDLDRGFPDDLADVQLAYAESASFVEFLFERFGPSQVRRLIELCGTGIDFDRAFATALGPRPKAEADWMDSVRLRYRWVPLVTGSGTLFTLTALLCLAAYARVRRRKRSRMNELELDEQAFEAAQRIHAAEQPLPQPAPAELTDDEGSSSGGATKPTIH